METIHRGNAAEAAVLHKLIAAGFGVLLPFGGGCAFDLGAVPIPDGDLLRIQVKSGRTRGDCVVFNTCSTDHGSGRRNYEGRADVIAVHAPERDEVFMVPVGDCPSFQGALRLRPTRNNQQRGIRYAADYEFGKWVEAARSADDQDADRPHLRHSHAEGPAAAA